MKKRFLRYIFFCFFLVGSSTAFAREPSHPDCSGPEQWVVAMVGARLKDLHLSTQAGGYDKVEVERLASEQIVAEAEGCPLFRQVHKVTIHDKGNAFVAVTVNTASSEECSESGVDVYFVSVECGGDDSLCRRHERSSR